MDDYMANAMFHAEETMKLIRKLATNKMPKKEAAEARTRFKSVANIFALQRKGKGQKEVRGLGSLNGNGISGQAPQLVERSGHNGWNSSDVGREDEGIQH